MAESVAGALIEEVGLSHHFGVESFGTAGYHVGQPADSQADAALSRGGWPHGRHRARQLSRADLERLDLVLCADQANVAGVQRLAGNLELGGPRVRLLRSYDPEGGPNAEVPDPWGLDDRDFDRVLEMIERACRGLVMSLGASLAR